MERLDVKRDDEFTYPIIYQFDFSKLAESCKELHCALNKVCIITDDTVAPLYLDQVVHELKKVYSYVVSYIIPAGESNKTLSQVEKIYDFLIHEHFDRKDMLVALGGGVIGDMTGFTAATYLRGIHYIQIPTTLLAQVDSSIGGKTGVDFSCYKNMIGAFHQPLLVYSNISTVSTLSDELYACGMSEILKHGLIKNFSYYAWLTFNKKQIMDRDLETVKTMIYKSNLIKKIVVENDPTEKGERAILNFGHTIGHAIEKLKDFQLMHGQCVSIGMVAALYMSFKKGYISAEQFREIQKDFRYFGLPIRFSDLDVDDILQTTKSDKKMNNGQIQFILLKKIGEAYIDKTITDDELLDGITVIEEV